jgi:hypothetical protein
MKFPKKQRGKIISGHECVEWFNSKRYAERRKDFFELQGLSVIIHTVFAEKWLKEFKELNPDSLPPEIHDIYYVCIRRKE